MRRRWGIVALLAAVLMLGAARAEAAPPAGEGQGIMPLSEIRRGMRGITKTVVEGTRVESFDVEVLGVLPDAGPRGDLIMIEVSEEMLRRVGGIASGTSGSPVYVDGRLIGAISYGFGFSDHRVGLVTPIEHMLELWDQAEPAPREEPAAEEQPGSDGGWEALVPLRTPLMVSGLSPRAYQRLAEELERRGFTPQPMVGGGGMTAAPEERGSLEPGSGLGIQLTRGDVNIYAFGTLTHVDEDRFLAFGHPFTNRGDTSFLATEVYVHHILRTMISPFKIASPLAAVGAVLQDRGAGVAGRLGEEVPLVRMQVQVRDGDRSKDHTFQVEIVRDEELLVPIVAAVALSAGDRALDRMGRGTAKVDYRVEGEGLPQPLIRTNLTYSDSDVVGASLYELVDAVRILLENPFEKVNITEIDVVVDVERERHTAEIEAARPLPAHVFPGDTVEVDVTLRPFRRDVVRERLQFQVPADAAPGQVSVLVRAGGWAGDMTAESSSGGPEGSERVASLSRLLQRMMEQEQNNDLVVELYPPRQNAAPWEDSANQGASGAGGPGSGEAEPGEDNGPVWGSQAERFPPGEGHADEGYPWHNFEQPTRVHTSLRTPYVLSGSTSFELVIRDRGSLWVPPEAPVLAPL